MVRKVKREKSLLHFKHLLIFLLSLFIIICIVYTLFFSLIFRVKELEVNLDKIDCAQVEQIKNLQIVGKNILFLNESKIEKDLKAKYVCVKKVVLTKQFPNKITVILSGREPAALFYRLSNVASDSAQIAGFLNIATQSGQIASFSGQLSSASGMLVDEEGVIFAKSQENITLPKIYKWTLQFDEKIDEQDLKQVINILISLKNLNMVTFEVNLFLKDVLVSSNPRVLFSLKQDINIQLAALQLIMTQAKISEENIEMIDLRFDKPIVRYAPKKK